MLLFFRSLKTTCPLAPSINSLPVMPSMVIRMPPFANDLNHLFDLDLLFDFDFDLLETIVK